MEKTKANDKRKYHVHVKGKYIGTVTDTLAHLKRHLAYSEVDQCGNVQVYCRPTKEQTRPCRDCR